MFWWSHQSEVTNSGIVLGSRLPKDFFLKRGLHFVYQKILGTIKWIRSFVFVGLNIFIPRCLWAATIYFCIVFSLIVLEIGDIFNIWTFIALMTISGESSGSTKLLTFMLLTSNRPLFPRHKGSFPSLPVPFLL